MQGTKNTFYEILSEQEYKDLQDRILYEDNHLLVINKKAGEISQSDKTGDVCIPDKYKALIAQRDKKPGQVFLGLPHRLDRPVSGILIMAKTSKALSRLSEYFKNKNISKTYWALTCEKPPKESDFLEDFIIRNEKQNKSYVCKENRYDKNAKFCRLRYALLTSTKNYHLLQIELYTGRHHQIRCQLANIGCHIKGDLKYGAKRSNPNAGICLHSRKVDFIHPVKKNKLIIEAPVPDDWKGIYL